jgi:hypothetical protein
VITSRTLWLLRELRAAIGSETDQVVRQLAGAWVTAWATLDTVWQHAVADILDDMASTGQWPAPYRLARLHRLAAAATQTRAALDALAAQTATAATTGAGNIVAATAAAEPAIMASQLPAAVAAAAIEGYAAAVAPSALEAIVLRAQQQIHAVTWPLSADAIESLRRALIAGVATGMHPRDTARAMLRNVQGAFNGGLTRAINLARTEMLDAYRDTSAQVHQANADVVDCWVWISDLGTRCCASCWSMHGTEHPVETPGPLDHQSGRCSRMAKLKSWAELGIPGMESDEDLIPKAADRFAALSPADKRRVMGPRRLALLTSGRVDLADLAMRRTTIGWRPSYVPRPVGQLEQIAARRRRDTTT